MICDEIEACLAEANENSGNANADDYDVVSPGAGSCMNNTVRNCIVCSQIYINDTIYYSFLLKFYLS